ncbi:tetratricopeptide repeat protein [Bdellovibrio sp. HCB337]|uniref:tetratricopeptide repeat protein n=1 Tax=Bdellovibrio sp. HCB337 TaxID=3394358 RepID=UPI0039A7856E
MVLIFLRRAALISAALFIFKSLPAVSAETKSKKAETSKDIIEKAYNLSLQKDRSQAINILVNAIKQENLRNGNTTELKKALQQVSYLFYSDRAQQTFELALSLRRTDAAQALQKMNEALRMEPDNLSLFNEMQRMILIKGDCSGALDNISKERLQDPFDENLILLQGQAQACLGQWEEFKKTHDIFDIKKSSQWKYWLSLEIEHALYEKNLMKAKEVVTTLQKQDPKYPELLYWQWRVASGAEKSAPAQKYIKECKNISATQYRQYMTDVNLCRKVVEVETAIKSSNGTNE